MRGGDVIKRVTGLHAIQVFGRARSRDFGDDLGRRWRNRRGRRCRRRRGRRTGHGGRCRRDVRRSRVSAAIIAGTAERLPGCKCAGRQQRDARANQRRRREPRCPQTRHARNARDRHHQADHDVCASRFVCAAMPMIAATLSRIPMTHSLFKLRCVIIIGLPRSAADSRFDLDLRQCGRSAASKA